MPGEGTGHRAVPRRGHPPHCLGRRLGQGSCLWTGRSEARSQGSHTARSQRALWSVVQLKGLGSCQLTFSPRIDTHSPAAGVKPALWAESRLVFNSLPSYSARNCTWIYPSASNVRPSLLPGCRTCDRFAYLRNPQRFNIHNFFKWDYQTNSNSWVFFLITTEENPRVFVLLLSEELKLDNGVMPSPFEMTANTNITTKIRSLWDLQSSWLCTFHSITTWIPNLFFSVHYLPK